MDNITYLQGHIMVFLLICIVATLLTFIATSYAVIGVMKLQEKNYSKKEVRNIMNKIVSDGLFGLTLSIVAYKIGVWLNQKI